MNNLVLATDSVELTFDLGKTGASIENKFTDINVWNLHSSWTSAASKASPNFFSTSYPFVKKSAVNDCYWRQCAKGSFCRSQ